MEEKQFIYRRAVITGASSGIGEEFARQLAPVLSEIILIARRTDRLEVLAEELTRLHPSLKTTVITCDLSSRDETNKIFARLQALPDMPTLLVNNAGVGDYGEFSSAEQERIQAMLSLNIHTLTMLTHALLPALIRGKGGIINISSLASSLPIPDFAVYAASKSYVLSFSEALRLELLCHGVHVLAVCPGPVHTEFGKMARRRGFTGNMMPGKDFVSVPREQVVRESISAIISNKPRIYPGAIIKCSALLLALLPMPLIRLIMGRRPRRCLPE